MQGTFTQRTYHRLTASLSRLNGELLLLAACTLLAAALRLYRLGEWSLWEDEAFTLSSKEDGFTFSFWRRPLSLTLIRLAVSALGASEWSARLVPALIGVLSIPALYYLVRRMFSPRAALLFAGLLSVSTWHLYWSQNARFYSLLILFYTAALFLFFIALEEDRPALFLLSFLCLGLAARERLIALFLLPVVLGYILLVALLPFEKPRGLKLANLALFFGPGILLGAFFAGPFLGNLPQWFEGFGRVNTTPFWILGGVLAYTGVPVVLGAAVGTVVLLGRRRRAALFFGLGAALPLLGVMFLSLFQYAANRYVFVSVTSWILLAGLFLDQHFRHPEKSVRLLAGGLLAVMLLSALSDNYLYYFHQNGNRADWRAAFRYIDARLEPGDWVVATDTDLGDYYLGRSVIGMENFQPGMLEGRQQRVWFIEDLTLAERYPGAEAWIKENARLMEVFDVAVQARRFTMRVYTYESR